jgi:hypothetical protein
MLRLATQALHRLHPFPRVPNLDRLRTDADLDPLPPQPRRHRVGVLLHPDRRPLAHPYPLTFQGLQTTRRQRAQPRLLLGKPLRAACVSPSRQRTHELLVLRPAGKVPAATQQQRLLQGLLETAMTLLAITVLVTARRIGRLGRHLIMPQQRLVVSRVLLGIPFLVHGQRHAIGAVPLGYTAQFPEGILRPFAQAGEALRETDRHVFPVRVGQHEVIQQVREWLPLDGDPQTLQVREVGCPQTARFVDLAEEHFLGRPVLGFPTAHPPFQRPPLRLPILAGVFPLQPVQQGFGLERGLTLQQFFQPRPDLAERIDPGAPGVGRTRLTGQLAPVAVFACGLAIHASLHRRVLQRCPPVQVAT